MSQIVDNLLVLSKADLGEIRLNREQIDLNQMLRHVVAQVDVLCRLKNHHIETSLLEEGTYIMGDPLRIRELFSESD